MHDSMKSRFLIGLIFYQIGAIAHFHINLLFGATVEKMEQVNKDTMESVLQEMVEIRRLWGSAEKNKPLRMPDGIQVRQEKFNSIFLSLPLMTRYFQNVYFYLLC